MAGSSKSALILGATGQTGRALLQQLLGSPYYSRVGEYGRKVTATENITVGADKLEQKVIDFEKLETAGLQEGHWDVVYIALGTTKKLAGSAENFQKIDRDYVINAAKLAKSEDAQLQQRLVYVSSVGANSSSSMLYSRSKGETEEGLAKLGYNDTLILRPAFLQDTNREDSRIVETIFGKLTSVLQHFSSSIEIKIPVLARAMYLAGKLGSEALPPAVNSTKVEKGGAVFTLIENSGLLELGKFEETQN